MKRMPLSKGASRRVFKKRTGIHVRNLPAPRNFRGGIRL